MEKVIKLGKIPVKLSNNVAWTMEYRDQFGKDVVQDHVPMIASIVETIAGVVAENGTEIDVASVLGSIEGRVFDLMLPLMQTEFMSTIINITWAMAKAADEDIDPPKQWARQFDSFPVDVVAPVIYDMMLKCFVSSKNLTRLKNLRQKVNLQPSPLTTSSSQEQNEG